MRRIHSSHSWLIPAARTAVKGAPLCARREAGPTLDGRRSGGYARERAEPLHRASILCFQYVYAIESLAYMTNSPKQRVGRLVLRFQCVDELRRVNALVFATAARILLIVLMFTRSGGALANSYPAGDDVSTFIRCDSSVRTLHSYRGSPFSILSGNDSWRPSLHARRRRNHLRTPNRCNRNGRPSPGTMWRTGPDRARCRADVHISEAVVCVIFGFRRKASCWRPSPAGIGTQQASGGKRTRFAPVALALLVGMAASTRSQSSPRISKSYRLECLDIMDSKSHWESVYNSKANTDLSWTQSNPRTSLSLISEVCPRGSVVDIGAGNSP